jgi:hypothetical protein
MPSAATTDAAALPGPPPAAWTPCSARHTGSRSTAASGAVRKRSRREARGRRVIARTKGWPSTAVSGGLALQRPAAPLTLRCARHPLHQLPLCCCERARATPEGPRRYCAPTRLPPLASFTRICTFLVSRAPSLSVVSLSEPSRPTSTLCVRAPYLSHAACHLCVAGNPVQRTLNRSSQLPAPVKLHRRRPRRSGHCTLLRLLPQTPQRQQPSLSLVSTRPTPRDHVRRKGPRLTRPRSRPRAASLAHRQPEPPQALRPAIRLLAPGSVHRDMDCPQFQRHHIQQVHPGHSKVP